MAVKQKKVLHPGERISVLVVDDSVVARNLVARALEEAPLLYLSGWAPNGVIALQRIAEFHPDVMILDIEMPEMEGLETLRRAKKLHPQLRVVMFSVHTERGGAATLEALGSGADDYVTKTTSDASVESSVDRSLEWLRRELIPRIHQFFEMPTALSPAVTKVTSEPQAARFRTMTLRPKVLVIGVSTGGPNALGAILPTLPADFPLPILLVQHMSPMFTRLLAERLNSQCSLAVVEAVHGQKPRAGTIYVAPGDFHMMLAEVAGGVRICLDQSPPQNSCRPSVDALFASAAEVYGGAVLAVILTGMGSDGLRGVRNLKAVGATVLAQDQATSVVWGMPGVVVNAGLADQVLALNDVIPAVMRAVNPD